MNIYNQKIKTGNESGLKNRADLKFTIQAIGLFLLAFPVFVGANFRFNGNLAFSIPVSLLICCIAFALTYLLIRLKTTKEYRRQKKVLEIILLIAGFGSLSLFSGIFFFHFFNIEINLKSDKNGIKGLKTEAFEDLNLIKQMFIEYDLYVSTSANTYEVDLDNCIRRSGKNCGINTSKSKSQQVAQKNAEVSALKTKLKKCTVRLSRDASTFIGESLGIVGSWEWLSLPETFSSIPIKKQDYLNELNSCSKTHPFTKASPFNFDINTNRSSYSYIPLPSSKDLLDYKMVLSFLFVNILILWPYLTAGRPGGRPKPIDRQREENERGGTLNNSTKK